jgi:hypothetical protein
MIFTDMRRIAKAILPMALALCGGISLAAVGSSAQAQDIKDALSILKAMSDYLSSQKNISVTFNSDIEIITPDLQKIQFTSSSQLQLTRPDKLYVSRAGGYSDVELFFDGSTFTVSDRADNVYAQAAAPGTVDQLITKMRSDLGIEAPGADLLLSDIYDGLTADMVDAKHIGQGVVNGVTCEHLAFRDVETDWQIWIEIGPNPVPRKYVITSKSVTAAPQYTLLVTDWRADATVNSDLFAFKEPAGAKKVDFKGLPNVDEVPTGVVKGEKQ